jgi:TetR/AcrR family transcriptional repressor of nem operon
MTRYRPGHKEATRQRMVDAAAHRFKGDGIDGSGIATLVADAGLTNGAFYGHFSSKDDLVAAVVAQQLAEQVATVNTLPAGLASLESFLRDYLSPRHRDDRPGGCPSAALLDEIGRRDEGTRQAFTDGARAMLAAIARHLDDSDHERSLDRAVALFSLLVGSLQLSRAVTDPELATRVLAAAYDQAMVLAGAPTGATGPAGGRS